MARADIAARLIEWYRAHRRELPWRGTTPYGVWVSEIMLQQTQVVTVTPFFNRFLAQFPTVEALAAAELNEVLAHWAGLGYYARARNLHRAARLVVQKHSGQVPDTLEAISALPGIGRYTAGAILSIAYDLPLPLVDTNVIRVLCRVVGLRGDPKTRENQAALWALASELVPERAAGDFNQGLMELGALVCTPADPACERCPLLSHCYAGSTPDPTDLPESPPGRPTVAESHSAVALFNAAGEVLIVRRPPHGLSGGLWELPRVVARAGELPRDAAVRAVKEIVGLDAELDRTAFGLVKHTVTHHRIALRGFRGTPLPSAAEPRSIGCAETRWEAPERLGDYPFAAPQVLLRQTLLHWADSSQGELEI